MKHLNFLSKSSSRSCGHSSVTLASTVGSQEEFYVSGGNSRGAFTPADVCQTSSVRLNRFTAHRRGIMLKLVSVLVLILTFGVGNVWGAGAVSISTTAKTFPAGSTSPSTNAWKNAGAPDSYPTSATDYTINSNGSWTLYNAADYGNSDGLQLKASGGYIQTTISSSAGVDIVVGYKVGNNNIKLTLTGATADVTGSSTSATTASISTTSTSATFKILKEGKGAGYIKYITITPKASSKTLSSIAVKTAPTKVKYVAGENFDPSGLKITATYSDASKEDISYAAATFTLSPTTSTALTTSNTSVSITYGGKSTSQAINVYNVTMQARDEDGNAIPAGGPGAPSRSGKSISPAADAGNYVFKQWQVTNASLGSSESTKSNTITNPSNPVTVTAVYYKPIPVTWNTNGSLHETTYTGYNQKPVFPDEPSSCDATSTAFYGWATSTWDNTVDNLTGKTVYTAANDMPNVTATGVVYNAVFAKASSGAVSWTKVTNSISAGDVIVLVNETASKELSGVGDINGTSCGLASDYTTTPAGTFPLTVETGNGGTGFSFKNGSNYLSWSGSSNNLLTSTTKDNASSWTVNNSSGNFTFSNVGTTGRKLQYNSGSPRFCCYTSSQTAFQIYKRSVNITYSKYLTTCCTQLGSINGSISLTQDGNDLVASGWGATTGGNETGYLVKLYNSDKSSVITSGSTDGTTKTYTFENPGAGTYRVSVTPTYSGAGNYCASGVETFSAASIDISGKVVITFKKNGATGTDDQTQEVDYNTQTALEDVSARSYTAPSCKEFGGWASSEANATAGTVAYANGANITPTEATTLWAIWKTKTFAVTDGTIASSVASHSYSVNTIACGNDLTITCAAAAAYKGNPTVTATGTHGAITVNSATSVTIANVQSAIAVSIAYNTPKETATVILHDATGAHTQDGSYYEMDNYTLPNTAAACTESELYGWYTETYVDQPTAPSGEKYIAKEASKALVSGENHFYAVYATIEDRYTNNYTKITSVGDLTTGDYLISSGSYCMSNTISSTNRMAETSVSAVGDVKTTDIESLIWTIAKSGTKVTLYNANKSKYLAVSGGVIAVQTDAHNFTFDYGTTKANSWTFTSESSPTYQLSYSTISGNTYSYFVMNTSQGSQIDLYKRDKAPSAGAPYTTSPSCTSHTLSSAIDPSSPVSGTIELGKTTILEGKTTKATATPSEHYTFSHWTISGTDAELDDATANPVTVTMGTENAIVTAHFTEKEKCTVEFYNNGGSALSSTTYWLGETPTAPTLTDGHDHDACDETSTTHYGWTQTAWTETLTKEQVDAKTAADVKVYAKAAALPAIAAEDDGKTIKYYAVWVKKETSGSEVTKTYGFEDADDASCWTITDAITKTSGQGATGSYAGTINTNDTYITFNDKVKVTNFSFKLKRKTDNSNYSAIIETSADGSNWSAAKTVAMGSINNGSYSSVSHDFDGETALYVRFHCSNTTAIRYVDDISITYDGVTTTYSAFLTNCIPSHSVSSAVDPTGKATVTLGANSVAEGSTTTAEYSDITAGYEFVNWTISGTGATLSSTTDNPTTITMGTADVTVTANLQCVKPTFTVHPQSKTDYLTTGSATALSYTASAAGASLTQQWQVSNDNSSWDDIDGATSATYTPNIATEGTKYYRVVVTNSECGESKTSDVATITSIAPSGYCISLFNSNNNGIQSGFSNGGEGNEYTLAFTVPGKDGSSNWPQYWIGENNAWASYSANANFADMKFTSSDGTLGLAEGATGTLHIWDDNKASGSNLHVKFEPSGYGFRWGDHNSDDWTAEACTKAFTVDANNANTYWTELVTLDGTNNTAWDYYVGLQTASGYVYSGVDDEANDNRGISRTRSVTAMKVSNGTAGQYKATNLDSEPTGAQGKFRIWNNNIEDYNFVCHFVPFYQLKYNANGGSGTMDPLPATPVSCEESAENRTVTVAANTFTAPTGKQFVKWNTAADGNGADVAEGEYVLISDVTLYAIWADADYTVTISQSPNASATTTGQTTTAHYNGTIELTTTVPEGYEFINWTSDDVTISNPESEDGASFTMPAQNVTVTANFQQIYTITWSANGATTTSTVNAGNKLVLPVSEPTTCNGGYSTFIGWYTEAAGSAEEPSANVSGTKADADHTPTGNETYYAVWANGDLVGGWQKATSIAAGDVILFVHESNSAELGGIHTNTYGVSSSYTTSPTGAYPLTVEAGNGGTGYSFKTSTNKYLTWGSGNSLDISQDKDNASSWTISASSADGDFRFDNVGTTSRILQYNASQPRWACYTSDQQPFQIYKQIASATEFISGCCTEWDAPAISYSIPDHWKAGDDDVAVSIAPGTTHGAVSFESSDEAVLTVDAETGAIHAVAVGTATVTATWGGGVVDAVRYCTASSEVEVAVSGTVTITFNGNDATSGSMNNQVIYYNEATALSANEFARTGYTFYGWAETEEKADAGNRDYEGGESITFTTNKTLYAVWHANKHKVTLNEPTGISIEATGAANLASVAYGTEITLSAEENDGYVFTGWSASGVDLANTNPVVFTMPDNDVTVTATYSTYEWIVADPRYSVTTDPKTSYYKVEKFSTAGVVIKENFKRSDDNTITKQEDYDGVWTATLNGDAIANGADLSLDDNNKTLKLYIGEDEIASYTLKVNDIVADLFIDGLWGETFDPQINTYNMPTPTIAHSAGATDCAKHNTFAGWILEANAENPTVENIITGSAATGVTAANNTYYAVWSKSENVKKEFTVSKTGFASGEISSGTISTGITYTTQKNGGSTDPAQSGTNILRLYQIKSGQKDGNSITISAASGMTLTKVEITTSGSAYGYVTDSYTWNNTSVLTAGTVTGGKITLEGLSTTTPTTILSVVNMATTNDYRLDISKIEVTYETEVTEIDYITDCDPRYDVEFSVGTGATGSYDKVTKKAGVEITLPDGTALSKEHHTFAGWYSAHYDVTYSESTSMAYTVPVDGETLVAQWTEDHHAFVHFMNGESEITGSPIKVYDGETFDLAAALVEAGKEFIGWKWNGSMYTGGQASQHMDNPAEDRTYVAVWMPVIDVATIADADLSDGKWILVHKKSQLKAGDFIVIAAAGSAKALSNNQKTSNRGDAAVTKIADTLTYTSNVAPLFLQYDPESELYALYDRAYDSNQDEVTDASGYLFANGGSTSNLLKTQTGITMQGLWAIDIVDKKASIVAQGNNANTIMRYNSGSSLFTCYGTATQQDIAIYKWAKNISSDMNVSDVTNTDIVIVTDGNTLTIDEPATLDNLIVENGGKVTGSATLTVNDFTIEGTHGKSGQVMNAENLHINGEAYFDFTLGVDVSTTEGAEKAADQWHNFSVPFPVSAIDGVFNAETGEKLTNEVDYAIEDYHGELRKNGDYGWKKFRGIMTPGHTYSMTVNGDIQTYRFKKVAGDYTFVAAPEVEFYQHAATGSGTSSDAGWNGLGNMRLCYSSISNTNIAETTPQNQSTGRYVLVLDAQEYKYVAYLLTKINLTVGSAFFIQASDNGTMGFNPAQVSVDKVYAPARTQAKIAEPIMVTMSGERGTDHMYISADEDATSTYQIGRDMQRMFASSNPTTPLIYTMNYGGLKLAAEDAPMVNDQAVYTLQLYAPIAGEYTLQTEAVANADVYLTYQGTIIWNISESEYTVDLNKGKNDGYGLLLRAKAPSTATGVDEINAEAGAQKVIINDHVYILRGGEIFDVTGKAVQ